MPSIEAWILGISTASVGALLAVIWKMLGHRINAIEKSSLESNVDVGKRYSRINDRISDLDHRVTGVEKEVVFADKRHNEITEKLDALRTELRDDKKRLEDKFENLLKELSGKIDSINERRHQPRGAE